MWCGTLTCFPFVYSNTSSTQQEVTVAKTGDSNSVAFHPAFRESGFKLGSCDVLCGEFSIVLPFSELNVQLQDSGQPSSNTPVVVSDSEAHNNLLGADVLLKYRTPEHDSYTYTFLEVLQQAVAVRVDRQSNLCSDCIQKRITDWKLVDHSTASQVFEPVTERCGHTRVALLFSGGIDSLVLAALADR